MITIYSNEEFYNKFYDTLLENEACQQLIVGNLKHVLKEKKDGTLFGVITVDSNQYFVCYFPPYSILVTCFPGVRENECYEQQAGLELASYLEEKAIHVRGINAPRFVAESFSEYYANKSQPMAMNIAMDVMELKAVKDIPIVGVLEHASKENIEQLSQYYINFCLDALGEAPTLEATREKLLGHIDNKVLYVLKVKNEIVSMCATARKLERGYSINAVYTVPHHRGKGYCKSMMAQVCNLLLKEGNEFVCLYVDQANPMSNAAYEAVGFKIVGSSCEYLFKEYV